MRIGMLMMARIRATIRNTISQTFTHVLEPACLMPIELEIRPIPRKIQLTTTAEVFELAAPMVPIRPMMMVMKAIVTAPAAEGERVADAGGFFAPAVAACAVRAVGLGI